MGTYNSMTIVGVLKDEFVPEMTRLLKDYHDYDNIWETSTIPEIKAWGENHPRACLIPNTNDSYMEDVYTEFVTRSGSCNIEGNRFYMAACIKNYEDEFQHLIDIFKLVLCTNMQWTIQLEDRIPFVGQFSVLGEPLDEGILEGLVDKESYVSYIKQENRYDPYESYREYGGK